MQNNLTIVLACHNRPKKAVKAIHSILRQTDSNFNFLVSDNSTNNELQEILITDFPSVETIFWNPGYSSFFDHFNKIVSLIKTKYITIFHDDDALEPDYVKRILEEFRALPNAAAIGTNATYAHLSGNKTIMKSNGTQVFNNKIAIERNNTVMSSF